MTRWMKALALCASAALLLPAAAPSGAGAQSLVSTGQSFLKASLVDGGTAPDGTRMAGLVLDLAPGWKTYWRSPGAAGVPPSFDWSRSRNLASAEVLWPRPELFESFGLTAIGYKHRVVFPLRLVPEQPGQPIDLGLDLAVGVCGEICVLEEAGVGLRIDPAGPGDSAALVAEAQAMVPRPAAEQGLSSATCRIEGAGTRRRFDAELDFGRALPRASVLLEGPAMAWFEEIETREENGRLRVTAALSLLDESAWVNRSDLRMTVLADGMAADIQGCAAPAG